MKMSEAIRLGAMLKPQGFGGKSVRSATVSCALGSALDALGVERQSTGAAHAHLVRLWPWSDRKLAYPTCPVDGCREVYVDKAIAGIWHLNDQHKWTRERIAGWVETIEPQEVEAMSPAVHVAALTEARN
jgi:hypothetical protein